MQRQLQALIAHERTAGHIASMSIALVDDQRVVWSVNGCQEALFSGGEGAVPVFGVGGSSSVSAGQEPHLFDSEAAVFV